MVKNLPVVQEMGVQSLGQEDPLEEETAPHSNFLLDNSMDRGAWRAAVHGVTASDTTVHTPKAHCRGGGGVCSGQGTDGRKPVSVLSPLRAHSPGSDNVMA